VAGGEAGDAASEQERGADERAGRAPVRPGRTLVQTLMLIRVLRAAAACAAAESNPHGERSPEPRGSGWRGLDHHGGVTSGMCGIPAGAAHAQEVGAGCVKRI
jgi:hypothetical protein